MVMRCRNGSGVLFPKNRLTWMSAQRKPRNFSAKRFPICVKGGVAIVRLDAFAYAVKKRGTNCFFVEPEVWELLDWVSDVVKPYGSIVLPEIHEHYSYHKKLADRGYWTYDFALPMLLLHALYFGNGTHLKLFAPFVPPADAGPMRNPSR